MRSVQNFRLNRACAKWRMKKCRNLPAAVSRRKQKSRAARLRCIRGTPLIYPSVPSPCSNGTSVLYFCLFRSCRCVGKCVSISGGFSLVEHEPPREDSRAGVWQPAIGGAGQSILHVPTAECASAAASLWYCNRRPLLHAGGWDAHHVAKFPEVELGTSPGHGGINRCCAGNTSSDCPREHASAQYCSSSGCGGGYDWP